MSRVSDRTSTKAAMHKRCQGLTKGQVSRARRMVTGKSRKPKSLGEFTRYTVTNIKTKKAIQITAYTVADAIKEAMTDRLARNVDNLVVTVDW